MSRQRKKFKAPPKRFQPRGMTFLHEDHDILVVAKDCGLLTVGTDKVRHQTASQLLTDYVKKGSSKSPLRVHLVHRLDRDTSGVLIFAKTAEAQRHLQDQWGDFQKRYVAVVRGAPAEKEATLSSYLAENSAHRVYVTPDRKEGKLAETRYRVAKAGEHSSLLEIELLTGRKNQIRVQLADLGHPVLGDKKYGILEKGAAKEESAVKARRLCLHAASLTCTHPFSKEEMTFEAPVPGFFRALVK